MKKTSLVLVLLLISIFSFAQAPDWQWAAQAGGNSYDRGNAITIDDAGNSYVIGKFEDTATFGSYSLTSSGLSDIFVSKIDSLGIFIWATKAGGISEDIGYGITIDDTGNSYVTGCFEETATFGSYTLTSNGRYDIFVAKMDTNGNWLWASKAGGNWYDQALDISKDNFGNCYVTGYFNETVSFGSYSLTSSGLYDIFIAKIDTNGNWLWASKAGGDSYDRGYGITIDDTGNSYVTGCFEETATFGSYSLTSSGSNDIFVAKMDEDGNWLWVTQAGGTGNDIGYAITIDYNGNCYVTGCFYGTATFGSYSLTSSGLYDIFIAKIDTNGNWLWASKAGGDSYDYAQAISSDNFGNCYVTDILTKQHPLAPFLLPAVAVWIFL